MEEENGQDSEHSIHDSYDFDIFDQFDKALLEYEQDLMKETTITNSMTEDDEILADPVETLVENTNGLLRTIDNKYNQVMREIQFLKNFSLKAQESDFEERLEIQLSNFEVKHGNRLKALKTLVGAEDRQLEQNMLMRFEDFNVLRRTTTSRLAVYEARLDTLERLVFELGRGEEERTTQTSDREFSESSESSETISEEYEELGGRDFSMLGLSSPGELDSLDCLIAPCDR